MHFDPKPMTQTVPERFAQASLRQHHARSGINGRNWDARRHDRHRSPLRLRDGIVDTVHLLISPPETDGPCQIDAVSVVDAAKVQ
jgi:hypothetical protein